MKRSVQRKLEKAMFCEVCRVSIPNYLSVVASVLLYSQHVDTKQHQQRIHSGKYFGFLDDLFDQLLFHAWRCVLPSEASNVSSVNMATDRTMLPESMLPQAKEHCYEVASSMRVWLFPQYYEWVEKREKCKSFTISDALRESIRRVVTTPMKPLLYPVDRKDQDGEEKK